MSASVEIYRDTRSRFIDLLRSLPEGMLDRWVPACPQWSVREIAAHVTGVSADFIAQNFPGPDMPFECWTAIQVHKRAGRSLAEVLKEWDELAPTIITMLGGDNAPDGPLIADLVTHEQDIRGALGMPGGRESRGYAFTRDRFLLRLGDRIRAAGLPALSLHTDAWSCEAGDGEPAASVTADTYELERALAGRRSWKQIAGFIWQGDAAPYHRLIPIMGPSKFVLIEPA